MLQWNYKTMRQIRVGVLYMKKPSRLTVALFGVCAAIWTFRAILEVFYRTYHDSVFWFVLNVLCAVVWVGAFIVNLKKYQSHQDE